MSKKKVGVDQLQVGVYVELDIPWVDHPFMFRSFKIKNAEQLRILQGLGLQDITYDAAKSDCQPLPPEQAVTLPPPSSEPDPAIVAMAEEKKRRREVMRQRREKIQHCEKTYHKSMDQVKTLMRDLAVQPKNAVAAADSLIGDMLGELSSDGETMLHLINEKAGGETSYYHALNVTVLSLMLGRQAGINTASLKHLGVGALLHDLGKIKIPSQILLKPTALNKSEQALYEQHTLYGVNMARTIKTISEEAITIIQQHHEYLDGSGYPNRLRGEQISPLAKIVAITNTYDNLCNPSDITKSVTPHEALSHMFKRMSAAFDPVLLKLFVKNLGVYPPGTIVQLEDGRVGLVISVNTDNLLFPNILLYDENVPRSEAVVIDLSQERDITIAKSLRPNQLSMDAFHYLSPRTQVTYYFDKETGRMF